MPKLHIWAPDEAQHILQQRLADARQDRLPQEKQWRVNEQTIFQTSGNPLSSDVQYDLEASLAFNDGPDQAPGSVSINYAFKNARFIHAQLAANPPSVVPRPASSDPEDRRRADAADRLVRYARTQYAMQETVDKASWNTVLYGTGVIKTVWNPDAGEILDLNEESGELTMEGDFRVCSPNIWNIFLDPDAEETGEIRFVFERIVVPFEEAVFRWPERREILEKARLRRAGEASQDASSRPYLKQKKYDVVELFEYWEKGLPINGMLGRYCICTADGKLVTPLVPSPERYAPPRRGKAQPRRIEIAQLPYHILTDIDVPNQVWGKSFVEYEAGLQEMLNRIDTVTLEVAQAHGIPRLILTEGAEVAEDSITNSPWDIIKITGTQPPHFMTPMQLPSIMPELMGRYKQGIDDMAGVNEAMFGQQSREQSGFSMQYATNQGNMIRHRLFNKYRSFVENVYKSFLRIVQKNWDIPRTILVLGAEKAFEAVDIKGADVDGGYDLVTEYGASLSLDPTTRREEMLTLMPLFEKAGVESRQILKMLKLNELSGAYDILDLAQDRQREIFEEMIATGRYLAPEELQDHQNMLAYAYTYLMTSEFKYLDEDSKVLVRKHVKDREVLAAQGAIPPGLAGTPGPAPAGLQGGMPPVAPGMQPGQVEAEQLPPT